MADESQDQSKDQSKSASTKSSSYADLFHDAIERIARLDSNARLLSANNQFADLFGYSGSEMIGMSLANLLPADDKFSISDLISEMNASGRAEGVVRAKTKAGDDLHIQILLLKGIAKTDSNYFCYCLVDLINPAEISNEPDSVSTLLTSTTHSSQQEQYRSIVEGINAIFWECSYPDFKFSFISQSITPVLGFAVEDWVNTIKFNPEQIHPEDIQQVLDACLTSVKQGKDFELVYRVKNQHGQYVWLQDIVSVVLDDNQNVFQLRGVSIDVSAAKIEEQVASNSRRRIFSIFDHIPNAVFQTRLKDGIVTRINSSFTQLTGYKPEEILGRNCIDVDFISEEINRELSERLKSLGKINDLQIPFKTKEGKTNLMNISSVLVIEEKIPYVFTIADPDNDKLFPSADYTIDGEDIQLLSEALPICISYLDSDLRFKFTNKTYDEIFNISHRNIIGEYYYDVIGMSEYKKIDEIINVALKGKQVGFEYQGIGRLSDKFFEVVCAPKVNADGSIAGLYLLSSDITEKKKSKYNEIRLGDILEQSFSEFYIFDIERKIFNYANKGARENIGYEIGEIKNHDYLNITPDLDEHKLGEIISALHDGYAEVYNLTSRIKRNDGTFYTAEINIQLTEINDVKELVFLVNDITAREETEERLKRAEKILSSIKDPILFIDSEFTILFTNQNYLEAFQCKESHVLNKKLNEIWDEKLFLTHLKPDLERVLRGESLQSQIWMTMVGGERHLSIQYSPYFSKENSIIGIVMSLRDITEFENTKHALSENEERFRLIAMATNDALYDWDLVNKKVWRNDKDFANLYSSPDLEDWPSLIHPKDRDDAYQAFKQAVDNKENYWAAEYRLKQIDGRYLMVYDRAYILYDDNKQPIRVMGAMTDITDRKKVEDALIKSEEKFRALYQDNPLMMFSLDDNGVILSLNRHVTVQLGYKDVDILGETIYSIVDSEYVEKASDAIKKSLSDSQTIQRVELEKKLKAGGNIWVRYTVRSISDQSVGGQRILIVCEDISENKRLSEQLSYQASHDSLTGLVNRAEFERRLERVLSSSENHSAHHALCYLDLDQFKIVNDTCGHIAGDELLRQISGILGSAVRKRDTLARLGGDEFGILMEHCTLEQAQRVANEMRKHIEEFRYIWEGKRFILGVSIGLVPIEPRSHKTVHSIMREADVACYAAKDAGRNRVHIYTPDDPDISGKTGQVQWAAIINQALDEERFVLHYQKIAAISPFNSEPDGQRFEILLRMKDEKDNLIKPSAFMPSAERYNLAVKVDNWVFNQVLDWLTSNTGQLEEIQMCAINISGHSMNNVQYLDFVLQKLYETNIPPDKICFEITETAAISNISTALTLMQTIKSVGCKFALDDFGSGVSSFAYLKQLPVDYLKIDGSFVRDIADDQVDYEMVRSIKDVAGVMGMKTIAEFVENAEIKEKLLEIGIDYGQGYYIAEPEILK